MSGEDTRSETVNEHLGARQQNRSLPATVRQPDTLICLMGEQTHPSLILAGKLERSLKKVVLLGTADVKQLMVHAGAAIADLLGGAAIEMDTSLPPYDWRDTETIVRRWIELNPAAVLDLTGGTKPMVIGAYRAGTAARLPLVYVDTRAERIQSVGDVPCPITDPECFPEIRADVLLRARGFKATHGQLTAIDERRRRLVAALFADPTVWRQWASAKGQGSCDAENNIVHLPEGRNAVLFLAMLKKNGLAECRGHDVCFATADDFRFFTTGFWLERYVAEVATKTGVREVLLNWKCFAITGAGEESGRPKPDYEFDVVLTRRATLYFISCKTGKVTWEDIESFANAVRHLGGTFAKGALATLQPVQDKLLDKAKRSAVQVWDAKRFNGLHKHIQAWL